MTEEVNNLLKERMDSGQYFTDSIKWYQMKYVYPFCHRSYTLIIFLLIIVIFGILADYMQKLLPLVQKIEYSVMQDNIDNKLSRIIRANNIAQDENLSVADILLRNYVTIRESYDYDQQKNQYIFVQNNSTRIMFKRFYNAMGLDNPNSPIMKFRKEATRSINIIDVKHDKTSSGKATITFESKAQSKYGEILEDKKWQALVEYEIDPININAQPGSRFNFTVTNYQLL